MLAPARSPLTFACAILHVVSFVDILHAACALQSFRGFAVIHGSARHVDGSEDVPVLAQRWGADLATKCPLFEGTGGGGSRPNPRPFCQALTIADFLLLSLLTSRPLAVFLALCPIEDTR